MVFVSINLVSSASFLLWSDWSAFFFNQSLCIRKEAPGTKLSGYPSLLSFQTETQSWVKVCQIFLKVPLSLLIKHRLGFFCMRCLPTKLRVNLQFSGGLSFVCWKLCRATINKIWNCHLVEWNVHAFYLSFCFFFVFFQSRNIMSGDQLFLRRDNSKMDW